MDRGDISTPARRVQSTRLAEAAERAATAKAAEEAAARRREELAAQRERDERMARLSEAAGQMFDALLLVRGDASWRDLAPGTRKAVDAAVAAADPAAENTRIEVEAA